jgi:hypothetical protein
MNSTRIKLWKAKLKAARADERQWARVYNRAEKAMLRIGREIDELEKKIENELAKAEQRTCPAK